MSVKWIVHSGTEDLGPWSASRIRDELRAGRIDAFDLVSVVGGTVKRPLMEVDEIFENSRIQPAAIIQEEPQTESSSAMPEVVLARAAGADPVQVISKKSPNSQKEKQPFNNLSPPVAEASPAQPIRPRAFEALASPGALDAPSRSATSPRLQKKASSSSSIRRYVLLMPGGPSQGPFNSKEVLTLWYARKLDASTMVQRLGDPKRIEISKFVGFYERAEPSGIAFLVGTKMAEQARDRAHWWMIFSILLAVAMIFGALFYRSGRISQETLAELGLMKGSAKKEVQLPAEPETAPTGLNNLIDRNSMAPSVITPDPTPKTPEAAPQKVRPKISVAPKKAQVPRRVVTKYEKINRNSRPNYSPPSVRPIAKQVAPAASSAGSGGGAPVTNPPAGIKSPAAWMDGSTVTLSGYRFNVGLLNACAVKCKIPMNGPQGPVTAVFFKEAFGSSFATKSSGVTIVGTVRKDLATGSVQIFVQSVR